MWSERTTRRAGIAAALGGMLGLAVTPLIVIVKYSTGWSIIPKPAWEGVVRPIVEPLVSFASPVQLWMFYGSIYSVALVLMLLGVLALRRRTAAGAGKVWGATLWVLISSLAMVMVGDTLHSWTWHLGGETLPRPGLNPLAGLGISIAYLGLPIVFIASFALGLIGLRRGTLPKIVAVLLLLVAPVGVLMTTTLLPTMPSGSLALFSIAMIVLGVTIAAPRPSSDLAPSA